MDDIEISEQQAKKIFKMWAKKMEYDDVSISYCLNVDDDRIFIRFFCHDNECGRRLLKYSYNSSYIYESFMDKRKPLERVTFSHDNGCPFKSALLQMLKKAKTYGSTFIAFNAAKTLIDNHVVTLVSSNICLEELLIPVEMDV